MQKFRRLFLHNGSVGYSYDGPQIIILQYRGATNWTLDTVSMTENPNSAGNPISTSFTPAAAGEICVGYACFTDVGNPPPALAAGTGYTFRQNTYDLNNSDYLLTAAEDNLALAAGLQTVTFPSTYISKCIGNVRHRSKATIRGTKRKLHIFWEYMTLKLHREYYWFKEEIR